MKYSQCYYKFVSGVGQTDLSYASSNVPYLQSYLIKDQQSCLQAKIVTLSGVQNINSCIIITKKNGDLVKSYKLVNGAYTLSKFKEIFESLNLKVDIQIDKANEFLGSINLSSSNITHINIPSNLAVLFGFIPFCNFCTSHENLALPLHGQNVNLIEHLKFLKLNIEGLFEKKIYFGYISLGKYFFYNNQLGDRWETKRSFGQPEMFRFPVGPQLHYYIFQIQEM